jgi:hypothetical protein
VHFYVLWVFHHFQGVSGMSWLSTTFLLVSFAKALGRWLLVSIAGWRFAAVIAILCQLIFKPLYPPYELNDRLIHVAE